MHAAFVASADLRPMAQQLLQDRTPAAYSGVEAYARRHAKEDAGALAWLVLGYAHILDNDYARVIDPLNRAKPRSGDIADYVDYYLGVSYFQTGRMAEAGAILGPFEKNYPSSLLIRDANVIYANVMIADGRATEAIVLLEKDREPQRVDLELVLGRAYELSGNNVKAIAVFQNIYFTSPLSGEAAIAGAEVNKLHGNLNSPALLESRIARAALLVKGHRYQDAANEYQTLLGQADANGRSALELAMAEALRRAGQTRQAKEHAGYDARHYSRYECRAFVQPRRDCAVVTRRKRSRKNSA